MALCCGSCSHLLAVGAAPIHLALPYSLLAVGGLRWCRLYCPPLRPPVLYVLPWSQLSCAVVLRWCHYVPLRPLSPAGCARTAVLSIMPSALRWCRLMNGPPLRAAVLHSPVVCCAFVGVVLCPPLRPSLTCGLRSVNLPVLHLVWLSMAPSLAALLGWLALLVCGPLGGRAMPVGPFSLALHLCWLGVPLG